MRLRVLTSIAAPLVAGAALAVPAPIGLATAPAAGPDPAAAVKRAALSVTLDDRGNREVIDDRFALAPPEPVEFAVERALPGPVTAGVGRAELGLFVPEPEDSPWAAWAARFRRPSASDLAIAGALVLMGIRAAAPLGGRAQGPR